MDVRQIQTIHSILTHTYDEVVNKVQPPIDYNIVNAPFVWHRWLWNALLIDVLLQDTL